MRSRYEAQASTRGRGISPVFLAVAVILVMAAAFGGWYLARHLTSDYDKLAEGREHVEVYPSGTSSGEKEKNKSPIDSLELIYGYNVSTGRIDELYVCVTQTNGIPAYVSIAPEVSYTMTGELYRELTVDNLLVPQTVTLSELHRYYDNEKAYDAGRKIVGEMLGVKIPYYRLAPEPVSEFRRELESVAAGGEAVVMDAPVTEMNETAELDITGTAAIIYGLIGE